VKPALREKQPQRRKIATAEAGRRNRQAAKNAKNAKEERRKNRERTKRRI
jgi:hypothetical protein